MNNKTNGNRSIDLNPTRVYLVLLVNMNSPNPPLHIFLRFYCFQSENLLAISQNPAFIILCPQGWTTPVI